MGEGSRGGGDGNAAAGQATERQGRASSGIVRGEEPAGLPPVDDTPELCRKKEPIRSMRGLGKKMERGERGERLVLETSGGAQKRHNAVTAEMTTTTWGTGGGGCRGGYGDGSKDYNDTTINLKTKSKNNSGGSKSCSGSNSGSGS